MSGWWGHYNFRCQPVDYSNNPLALRVSYKTIFSVFISFKTLKARYLPISSVEYKIISHFG